MIKQSFLAIAVALFFTPISPVAGQHPRQITRRVDFSKMAEHSTRPVVVEKEVSTADISAGIRKNIKSESKKDGKFHLKREGKDLALVLVKVHNDRLSNLGSGKYFACVDMNAADGTTYDIDFFMSGKPGNMKVTETLVHKVNGRPLYNWKEEGGVWKKVARS